MLTGANRECGEYIKKSAPDHAQQQVVPLAWGVGQGLPEALPFLVTHDSTV